MIIRNVVYKILRLNLESQTYGKIEQFIKFCFVGVLNNLVYYISYLLLIKLGMHYTLANIVGFTVSVFNAFFWNNRYVFVSQGSRVWWKTFLKTYISYFGTGIVLSNVLLLFWVEICNISVVIAPLIDVVITMPLNFIINKNWAYKNNQHDK